MMDKPKWTKSEWATLIAAAPDLAKAVEPLIDRILDEQALEWPDDKKIGVPLGELRALFAVYRKAFGETDESCSDQ